MSQARRWPVSAALVLALVLAGCSTTTDQQPPDLATSEQLSVQQRGFARSKLVPTGALRQLTPRLRDLTLEVLVKETDAPLLADQLESAGFEGGVERSFRGRSKTITGAESRVLVFSTSEGAGEFSEHLAENPDPFFGGSSLVTTLSVGDAEGTLIEPPLCDCPGAHPLYVGVLATGTTVLWLQVTGPRASPARLRMLLDLSLPDS